MGDDRDIIQLDVEGSERRKSDGRRRIRLTAREREELKKRNLAAKAMEMLLERSLMIPEIAEELGVSQDLLARTSIDDLDLRQIIVKQAVQMFLDLDTVRSRKQIAAELGLTVWQLKILLDTDEFAQIYDDHFAQVTNDPTVRAVQTKVIEELLPKAVKAIDDILNDPKAPPTVRLKAALETMRLSGIKAASPVASERQELSEFLSSHNIVQVNVGEKEKVEVIEGTIKDT